MNKREISAGYVMVPVEPTPEMRLAGKRTIKGAADCSEGEQAEYAYKQMLAAVPKAEQPPVQEPVAYLDIGIGGYVDLGSDKPIEELEKLPMGRHMLAIIGTYGVDGYTVAPQPSDDAKDAARYRFLKSKCDTGFITNLEDNVFVSRWDAAIDAAMRSKGE